MAKRSCTAPGCSKPYASGGWCDMHRARMRRYGTLEGKRPLTPAVSRLWARVDKSDGCWLWTGTVHASGYGYLSVDGKHVYVHRLAYELLVGPIPEGLQLDHLCRVRRCVRPDHLEAVSQKINILRGVAPTALNAIKTHCPQGHPYDEANTYVPPGGGRACRACHRAHVSRAHYSRKAN